MTPSITIVDLRVERRGTHDTLGLLAPRPSLSWRTETDQPGWHQVAYAIEARDADIGTEIWASGPIASNDSHLVAWGGPDLASRQRVQWRVRVEGTDDTHAVSAWHTFEVGLLDATDWTAEFVVPECIAPADPAQPVAYLRREFACDGDATRARLHVAALGVYEIELNGVRVGDMALTPGWTSYDRRVRVETYDVTSLVRRGANAIGIVLADGWYGERYGFAGATARKYGDELAALAQLEVDDGSGARSIAVTDTQWRSARGPIVSSGIYAGETYDARLRHDGWSIAGFVDDDWDGVRRPIRSTGALVGRIGPPVRHVEHLAPTSIATSPSGRIIVDFGQNLVGHVRLTVDAAAGSTITVRHAEVLQGGELCTAPLRAAAATDRYVASGDGPATWEPRFTFHGFRYAEVDGWPEPLDADALRAVVVHSDMERTGWFECSDERVNRLHENIVWGMRGNFLDIPTDCPQRDERLGWTGDINVFARTACFLHDTNGFLTSWLAELAADQHDDGFVPHVVPDVGVSPLPAAVWGDAAVVVPWVLYERYGDTEVLRAQYESMRAWIDYVLGVIGPKRRWARGFQYGDWVDPAAAPDRPWDARTDVYLVAQAALFHSIDCFVRAAEVLGRPDDAARYRNLGDDVRAAFADEFVTPNGRLASDSQTAYALAIHWGLLTDATQRRTAGKRMAHLVLNEGFRIGTGFVGTPVVCDALCATGNADVAYALLEQTQCPSWLYPVLQGATTVWERWDALRPDGTINPGEMTSFNHYALGAVGDWLHRFVGGLAPAAPGYRRLAIGVNPGGSITWARTRHRTPYGLASVAWHTDGDDIHLELTVPPNTDADVRMTDGTITTVGSGSHTWTMPARRVVD